MRSSTGWIFFLLPLVGLAETSVELAGSEVHQGMPENVVRATFPDASCLPSGDSASAMTYCVVHDGDSSTEIGAFALKDGVVWKASRSWSVDGESDALPAVVLINRILARLSEEASTCAAVVAHEQDGDSIFAFPDKVLTITVSEQDPRSITIQESLRVNPAPARLRVRAAPKGGGDWCAFTIS